MDHGNPDSNLESLSTMGNRHNAVRIELVYRLNYPKSIPDKGKIFFVYATWSRPALESTLPLVQIGTGNSFPRGKTASM
jgi:hypothetical protein